MSYKIEIFSQDIQECLDLAKKELENRKNDIQGESTIEQLENFIIPDLTNLLSKINNNQETLPPNTQKDRFVKSFGYAFKVWGWDMMNPTKLYLKLLKLNENYRKI